MKFPFPINPTLTAIAIAYRNRAMIADKVLPRVPVGSMAFKWMEYPAGQFMTIPETTVGRKGRVNEVEFNGEERDASTKDYGLEDAIPQADIAAAATMSNFDPLQTATSGLANLIELDREVRVAKKVFDPSIYAHKAVVDSASKWSSASVNPIPVIADALDAPMIRPNVMVLGQPVATKLRQNPNIIKAYNGSLGDTGLVPLEFLRELFELEEIVIGQSRVNIAKPGQDIQVANVWGNHCALIHRNPNARPDRDVTFGITAQYGDRVAGSWEDKNIGLRGGQRVRVGESVAEVIMATDCAYFFQNAI